MVDDTIPGILYRLTVFEADGRLVSGFPKIYSTPSRFKAAIRAQERRDLPGRTWIKEGCARGPWLSLDGPVMPTVDVFNEAHVFDDGRTPHEGLPPVVVFYEAA